MNPTTIVTVAVIALLAFLIGWLVSRRREPGQTVTHHHFTLEEIREMGEISVLNAYIKEVVTEKIPMTRWTHTSEGKILLICDFDVEFRYNLTRTEFSTISDGSTVITLPPHTVKVIQKDVDWYHEEKVTSLGVMGEDITTQQRTELQRKARDRALEQAGVLKKDLSDKVQRSAKNTIGSFLKSSGSTNFNIQFANIDDVRADITTAHETLSAASDNPARA